jgi:uncharacterized membrane protein
VLSAAERKSRRQGVPPIVRSWRSRIRVEHVYLVVALVWGLLLVLVTPPLQTFDELAHYYRAWSVAEGQLVVPSSGTIRLPVGADDLTKRFPYAPIAMGKQKVDLRTVWAELDSPLGSRSVESSSFAASYGPVGYLPQAVGITVIRLFGGSPLVAMYLARVCNLLAAVLLTYFGLRFLPFARMAVCFVALLPMTMMEMASLSPDALLLGSCVFFSGLVIACTSKASLSRRDIGLLGFGAVVLLNAKPGYAVLSLLLLLLVPRQFTSRVAYSATVIGSIIASGLLALVFMILASNQAHVLVLMLGPDNHVNGMAQLRHVMTHPFSFARAIGATINQLGVFYLRQSVAAYAWGQLNIGDAVALVAAVGVAAVVAARERVDFPSWRRALVLAVAFLTAVGVSLGLYMGSTAVAAPAILGLQGRYFTPSVVLGFIGLAGFPFQKRWLVPAVVGVVILLLIVTNLRTILVYYY